MESILFVFRATTVVRNALAVPFLAVQPVTSQSIIDKFWVMHAHVLSITTIVESLFAAHAIILAGLAVLRVPVPASLATLPFGTGRYRLVRAYVIRAIMIMEYLSVLFVTIHV
jgi:hypothetical protein